MNKDNTEKEAGGVMAAPTILAIDDAQESLNLFSMILRQYIKDCRMLTALTGADGLRLAHEQRPDLILLDVKMPEMDGLEVCRRLKKCEKTKSIPVLMISGIAVKSKNRTEGLEVGAEGYICKPFETGELVAQAKALLRIKHYQDELKAHEAMLESDLEQRTRNLRESEERLRNLFDSSPDAIFVEDFDGNVLDVNPAACKLHEMKRGELIGKNVLELVPPDRREDVEKKFPGWLNRELKAYEGFSYTACGRSVPVEVRTSQTMFNGRKALLLHVRDITERRKNEDELERHRAHLEELVKKRAGELHEAYQALSESEKRYRMLAENSYDLIAEFNSSGEFLYANHQHQDMLGYDPGTLIGTNYCEYLHPDDCEKVKARLEAAMRNVGSVEQAVLRFRHAENGWRVLEGAARAYLSGGELHLVTSCRDITERQQMLDALTESRESFHNIVEKSVDGIVVVTGDSIVAYANPAACLLLEKPAMKFVGHEFELPRRGIGGSHDVILDRKSGKIVVEVQSTTTSWQGKDADLVMLRDITHRRKMEEELGRIQKLESVGVLAGGIAHDFNNILTGVIGNISFAQILGDDPAERESVLRDAEEAAMRARALTQQLLTFSKGGAPIRKVVSIEQQLRNSAKFVLAGSDCTCEFDIAENLWAVRVDIDQFSQVIENLVINADQAMPRGGRIKIKAENVVLEESALEQLPLSSLGEFVKITFQDEGVGIPDDIQDRIFDPYFTTKGHGSGLGLATVYSIIHNHDGLITVDSEIGRGTKFTIYLPAIIKKPTESKIDKVSFKTKKGNGRILIMDDESMILRFAQKALQSLGYVVETAEDGRGAIEKFQAARDAGEPFDALILDLTIPGGMSGAEVLNQIRGIDPEIKAILSSGYADGPVMAKYREYGFSAVLGKPFTIKKLGDAVHSLFVDPPRTAAEDH